MSEALQKAAQAVLDRWDSPQWEWRQHGPTADLMADLRAALAQPPAPTAQPAADDRLRMSLQADLAIESLAVDDLLRAMGEDPEQYRTDGGTVNRLRLLAWLKDRDAQPVQQPDPAIEEALAEGEFEPRHWTVSACRAIEQNPNGALNIIQTLKRQLAAAQNPVQQPGAERWVVVRQSVLDVGRGDDVRTGGKPELGYALISDAGTFDSQDEARDAIKSAGLPIGWVCMPVSRLLPDLFVAAPAQRQSDAAAIERERIARHFDSRDKGAGGFYDPHEPAEIIRAMGAAQRQPLTVPALTDAQMSECAWGYVADSRNLDAGVTGIIQATQLACAAAWGVTLAAQKGE